MLSPGFRADKRGGTHLGMGRDVWYTDFGPGPARPVRPGGPMSKFIDRLKQLSEGTPQPIGFRPRGAAPEKPKIQLVAAVADAAVAEQAAGADAVLWTLGAIGAED